MKSAPTEYKGIVFRSKFEARVAQALDSLKCKWTYEDKNYALGGNVQYRPDFFLPELNAFLEAKGAGRSFIENDEKFCDEKNWMYSVVDGSFIVPRNSLNAFFNKPVNFPVDPMYNSEFKKVGLLCVPTSEAKCRTLSVQKKKNIFVVFSDGSMKVFAGGSTEINGKSPDATSDALLMDVTLYRCCKCGRQYIGFFKGKVVVVRGEHFLDFNTEACPYCLEDGQGRHAGIPKCTKNSFNLFDFAYEDNKYDQAEADKNYEFSHRNDKLE